MSGIAKDIYAHYKNTLNLALVLRNILRHLECISTVHWLHFEHIYSWTSKKIWAKPPQKITRITIGIIIT